ncbi:Mfa1 family fimbria major subunit [Parabacteroides sp.]
MKKKNLLMFALAGLLFASCSEKLPGGEDGGGVLNPDGESWVSLNIQTTPKTKALNTPDEILNGTADETNVVGVLAVFFDAAGKATVAKDLTIGAGGQAQPGEDLGAAGAPFKVPNTSTKVLIVVNPVGFNTTTINSAIDNNTPPSYDDLNVAVAGTVSATGTGYNIIGSDKKAFMMTNATGLLEPYGSNLVLYPTEAAATSQPCVVHVDRVAAKVRLYMGSNYATPANVFVQEIGWVLNVTNKLYFPVSLRTETFLNTQTPFDKYLDGSYRIDPNYDHTSIAYPSTAYDSNYNYYTQTTDPTSWNTTETTDNKNVEYCLENTQIVDASRNDNVHAYTTHVIFKAKFTPTKFPYADGTPDLTLTEDQAKEQNWIRIGEGNYTFATLMTWIKKELVSYYGGTGYTPSITNAFIGFLGSKGIDIDLPTRTADAAETQATAALALFTAHESKFANNTGTLTAGMHGSVSYYTKGENYYKIMIKHDNEDSDSVVNELGEFGVVRNSVYDLTITSVNNPGYPVIPDPDPNTPDEDKDGWISVKININPWTWYTQEVPL